MNLKIILLLCSLAVVYSQNYEESDSDEGGLFGGTRQLFRRIGDRINRLFGRRPKTTDRSWTPISYPRFKLSRYPSGRGVNSDVDDDESTEIISRNGFGKSNNGDFSSYGVGASMKVASAESGEKYGGELQRTKIGSIEIIHGKNKAPSPDFELTSNVLDESKIQKRDIGPTSSITTFPDSFERAHDFYNRNKRHADIGKNHRTPDYSNEAYNIINRFQNIASSGNFHRENLFDTNDMRQESTRENRLLEEDNRSDSSAGFINIQRIDLRPYRRHAKGVNDEETTVIITETPEENDVQELLPQVEYVEEYEVEDPESIQREARTIDEDIPNFSTEQNLEQAKGWNVVNLLRELMTN